jgi:hypothetical protein
VLRGEVQQRLLHPASQRQMQHPEPPQQLRWVWTLQGGGQLGTWTATEAPGVQNGPNNNPKKVTFSIPGTSPKDPTLTPVSEASSSKQDIQGESFSFLKNPQAYHPSTIKNRRALDLFSGTGAVGRHLAKLGFQVTTFGLG